MPEKLEELTRNEGHYEYLKKIKKSFQDELYLYVAETNITALQKKNELIVDGLCSLIALLIDANVIDENKLKDLIKNGFKIKKIKPD